MTAFIPRKGTVTEFFDTKTKKFAKPFLPVHFGPRSNLLSQKMVKNRVTLSLAMPKDFLCKVTLTKSILR